MIVTFHKDGIVCTLNGLVFAVLYITTCAARVLPKSVTRMTLSTSWITL